jgi:hypothetical protein
LASLSANLLTTLLLNTERFFCFALGLTSHRDLLLLRLGLNNRIEICLRSHLETRLNVLDSFLSQCRGQTVHIIRRHFS